MFTKKKCKKSCSPSSCPACPNYTEHVTEDDDSVSIAFMRDANGKEIDIGDIVRRNGRYGVVCGFNHGSSSVVVQIYPVEYVAGKGYSLNFLLPKSHADRALIKLSKAEATKLIEIMSANLANLETAYFLMQLRGERRLWSEEWKN